MLIILCGILVESEIDLFDELFGVVVGLFGFFGYDMIWLVEYLLNVNFDLIGLLDVVLMCLIVVVVLDGVKGDVILIVFVWVGGD